MAKPIYGLVAAHPSDVHGYLNSINKFQVLLGQVNRVGLPAIRAFSLQGDRSVLTFSSIVGLDVVVEDVVRKNSVEFEDGEIRSYSEVTLYSAHYGSETVEQLQAELKRAGYIHCSYETTDAATYALIAGGTGDYSGANYYYKFVIRTGAGERTIADGVPYASVREIIVGEGNYTGAGGSGVTPEQLERSDGGYEFTGGFSDRLSGQSGQNDLGSLVSYDQAMVTDQRWLRFGFSSAANQANDNQYWGESDPSYDNTKGLFGGLHMPANVSTLFSFDDATDYNNASDGSLKYTAAGGSIDFSECRVGDLALVRFDFNVKPQVANTTLEVAMIWQTRNAQNVGTFTFALTGGPAFFGTGTVGRTFLNRPLLTAYFASAEDVNARALLAIRADNPIQVAPLTTLVTLVR
jgi:hypothetical protein